MKFTKWSMTACSILTLASMAIALQNCGKKDDEAATTGTFTLKGSGAATTLLGVNASAAKMKVYKFAVSKNTDCSNPVVVIDNGTAPETVDMFKGPNLGSGKLSDGEYPCAIIEMSDQLVFTPKADDGACKSATEYTIDVCGPMGSEAAPTTQLLDGTKPTCTASADKVGLYLSTISTVTTGSDAACEADRTNCNAFLPPTTSVTVKGIKLAKSLVVKGDTAGEFVIDLNGKISGKNSNGTTSDRCDLTPPGFSFKI